jgi:uncharacterized protein (DUF1501 family)
MEPLSVMDRRGMLRLAGLGGMAWLTPVAHLLAREAERAPRNEPAQSLIILWLAGGPSQLETFDPKPDTKIAAGTKAIGTQLRGVQLAEGLDGLAEQMGSVTLLRNMISKEGDHERGQYLMKTGYRPDPTVVHPSIGAICCHELPIGNTEIPRHISILPQQLPGQGGMLGKQYDAYKVDDPKDKVPDVTGWIADARMQTRLSDRDVVENAFALGRRQQVEATLHRDLMDRARKMMTSEQLKAFDVKAEPAALLSAYGNTPFGRGCLAARRLIEVGVRCVEVTLGGWDSHAKNHEIQRDNVQILDPAISTLLADLRERGLLDKTIVMCAGEFGRTPGVNRLGGRDHWPHGFSALLAGGRFRRGLVVGETDPEGGRLKADQGTSIPDLHATILTALGIDPKHEELAPAGRPIKFSEGQALKAILT